MISDMARPEYAAEMIAAREAYERAEALRLAPDRARRIALQNLGRPARIALVGCGKLKAASARPAVDLYIGPLFQAARRYALTSCDDWLILSAKHGIVLPDDVIAPYDLSITSLRLNERTMWGRHAGHEIADRYRGVSVCFIGLAGKPYLDAVTDSLHADIERPLEGLQVGERLRWFSLQKQSRTL
jgi:hypothetical protein